MFLVLIIEFLFLAPITFTVEDDALQKSGEIILGTYANLSCSYKSQEWLNGFFQQPFIKFFRLDKDGYETEIEDSHEKPPKYENQGEIVRGGGGITMASGTRKLFLRRIDAGFSATYLCRVQTSHGCILEKKLVLRTSMFYFQLDLHLPYKTFSVNSLRISTILDKVENRVRSPPRRGDLWKQVGLSQF